MTTKSLEQLRIEAYAAFAAHEHDMKHDPVYAAASLHVTPNERRVLEAIRDSEYQDGGHPADNHVWTDYINPFERRATMPGVVTSLVRKGLVTIYRGTTIVTGNDPSTIALTELGCTVLGITKG